MPVRSEDGAKCHSRAYESRLDADDASGQVPGVPQWRRTCLRSVWCLETQTGQARSHVGVRQEHFEQYGIHPIKFSCSTQHVIALSNGEAELYATGRAAAGGLQSVQLLRLEWSRSW